MAARYAQANKKPAAPGVAGSFKNLVLTFREGNDSCFHRHVRPGGGAFCASRCRVVLTHSLPQVHCLARNLITVFSCVNNPLRIFFTAKGAHGGVGDARDGRARGVAGRCEALRRAQRQQRKHLDLSALRNNGCVARERVRCDAHTTRHPARRGIDAPGERSMSGRKKSRRWRVAPPELRKVRGSRTAPRNEIGPREAGRSMPRHARRTHCDDVVSGLLPRAVRRSRRGRAVR